jgi:hypothetical protein
VGVRLPRWSRGYLTTVVTGGAADAGGVSAPASATLAPLLDLTAQGDADAFGRFYDATVEHAVRLARLLTRVVAEAEELVVRVYARAWRDASGFRAAGLSPVAWLLALEVGVARETGS